MAEKLEALGKQNELELNLAYKQLWNLFVHMVLALLGYGFLIWVDWRIAVGIFFINWSINRTIRESSEAILSAFDLAFKSLLKAIAALGNKVLTPKNDT